MERIHSRLTLSDRIKIIIGDVAEREARRNKPRVELFKVPSPKKKVNPVLPREHLMYDALSASVRGFMVRGETGQAAMCVLEQAAWDLAYGLRNGSTVIDERVVPSEGAYKGLDPNQIDNIYPVPRKVHGELFDAGEVFLRTKTGGSIYSDAFIETDER